jgi:hypothetical protein
MFSCPLLFVQYILSSSQYPETPRRFTTWGRAMTCLQETLKTFLSQTGNCISSDVILRNIYRLLLGSSQFTSFSIYVKICRKSALTLTPDCLPIPLSPSVWVRQFMRFECCFPLTVDFVLTELLLLDIYPTSCPYWSLQYRKFYWYQKCHRPFFHSECCCVLTDSTLSVTSVLCTYNSNLIVTRWPPAARDPSYFISLKGTVLFMRACKIAKSEY